MTRKKALVAVVVFAVLQFIFLIWQSQLFHRHSLNSMDMMERHMTESGVPPNQRGHLVSAIGTIGTQVSSYVQAVTFSSIMMNALLLTVLFTGQRRPGSPPED